MYHVLGLKQTRGIKYVTLKEAENLWVSLSTGKSNIEFFSLYGVELFKVENHQIKDLKIKFVYLRRGKNFVDASL